MYTYIFMGILHTYIPTYMHTYIHTYIYNYLHIYTIQKLDTLNYEMKY
jgi:hypothetical protein